MVSIRIPQIQLEGATRRARSIQRILSAAASMFGDQGFEKASMLEVARAAGVSKGLLHYHFQSKEHLLIETQRAILKQLNLRFEYRFQQGEQGLQTALEALDAIWEAVVDMRPWAPFIVETISLANQQKKVKTHLRSFFEEAESMLERSIIKAFAKDLHRLTVPPQRLTQLIRTCFLGLLVDLSQAEADDLPAIEQTYRDLRKLFADIALVPHDPTQLQEVTP